MPSALSGKGSGTVRALAALVAMALAMAGCNAGPTPTEGPNATPTAVPSATPTPTATLTAPSVDPQPDGITLRAAGDVDADGSVELIAGEPYVLDGARSHDDGSTRSFNWRQVSGPFAFISDASSPVPTFVPSQPGTYVFELTVSSNSGTGVDRSEVRVDKVNVKQEFGPVMATRGRIAAGGTVPVHFAIFDTTADAAAIALQYSLDGGTSWRDATRLGAETTRTATEETVGSGPVSKGLFQAAPTPTPTLPFMAPGTDRPVLVAITPTPHPRDGAAEDQAASGARHTIIWDSRSDLGTQAATVLVRGWDPVKKEAIAGTATVHYDPAIDEVNATCVLHADVWRLDAETTAVRNRMLNVCALRLVSELSASGLIEGDKGAALEAAVRDYSSLELRSDDAEKRLEESYASIDAQLANIDLQDALQQQSRTLQMLSNISKARHDAAMNSIRNFK